MKKNTLASLLCLFSFVSFAQLDITAIAVEDTLCQGESTILNIEGDALDTYSWSPAGSLTGANTASPTAMPTSTTTYTVTGMALGENLIENGDFSAGNTGFTTQYLYGPDTNGGPWGELSSEGTYAVTTNPSNVHSNFPGCVDHTSGNGNMLVVNGAPVPNTEVWCQTITVETNTTYQFSSWVNTMVLGSLAELQFSINGSLLGNTFFAPATSCTWEQFFELWDSGNNNIADICIVNQNVAVGGNDFGLDDISFVPVLSAESSVTVHVSEITGEISTQSTPDCLGNLGTASAMVQGGFEPYTYAWDNGEMTAEAMSLEAGDHAVTITDTAGCAVELSLQIDSPPMPTIDSVVVRHTSCGLPNGEIEIFAGDSGVEPFQYSVFDPVFLPTPIFIAMEAGEYIAVVQDANGCTATMPFIIDASDTVSVEIEAPNGTDVCLNADLLLNALGEFESYEWSSGETTMSITPVEVGDYGLTVIDAEGCVGEASIAIESCEKGWAIPNIFSPNGDGVNDLFQPFIEDNAAEVVVFKVYNRWGTLVHDSTTPWDGNYDGKPHPSDVLIYMIQFETLDGIVQESGQITLSR